MSGHSLISSLPLKGKRFLIVEDDFISAHLIKEMFHDVGVEIKHVLTASAAVEMVQNNTKFDLVFMDIQLPDMNGLQASQKIKAKNKTIPIVIQTAFAFDSYINKSKEVGCEYFLTKPLDPDKVYEVLKKVFKK